mgnify:CR=1 FL=1
MNMLFNLNIKALETISKGTKGTMTGMDKIMMGAIPLTMAGTAKYVAANQDDDQEEMALAVWEQSVNDDGPYILVYWKDTESDGTVVAGDFFLEAENVSNAQETGGRNNKAAIATAAAAIVIGLVWWKNRQE